jgi:gliding motility-associated-like protein
LNLKIQLSLFFESIYMNNNKGRILLIIILFLLIGMNSYSQPNKRTNLWFFSDSVGLDFNTGVPVENTSCSVTGMGWGAVSTLCDTSGNLMFYSNGDSIWNKNHEVMANGNGGPNYKQGTQSAICLPKPGSDSLYYIFTIRWFETENPMFYTTIDINENNGLGMVVDRDTLLAGWDASDQLMAVYLKNKHDYWILTRKYREHKFAAFLVTSEGVNPQPILSSAPNKDDLGDSKSGHMKVSYDKKYLVTVWRSNIGSKSGVEICKFNVETGVVEYLSYFRLRDIIPNNPLYVTYNLDFSPCSKYMYLSGHLHADSICHVFQFDMQYIEDSTLFEQSGIKVGEGTGWNMQMGPDGKIYLFFRTSNTQSNYINNYCGVINNPEKLGGACNYQPNSFLLQNGSVGFPFVNFAIDFLFRFDFDGICESDTFTFYPWFFPEPTFIEWNFGDPLSGINNTSTIPHATHKFTDGGTYEVSVYVEYPSGRIEETSRKVEVEYAPEPDLGPDTSFCSTSGITLDAECGPHFYVWSNGAFGSSQIIVSDTGWYWVRVENDAGCFEIDSIHLSLYPPAIADTSALEIKPTTCGGSTGVIRGLLINGQQPLSWHWLDDMGDTVSTSLDIYHLPVGNYTLEVLDGNGCITGFGPYGIHDAGEVLIESLEYTIEHCGQQDASITVHAVSGLGDMLFYSIDNGASYYANEGIFTGLSAGNYAVRVRDSSDCQDVYVNNPVIIQNTDAPEIVDLQIGACASGQSDGYIEITAIGGGDTLFYSNDNGINFQVNDGGFYDLLAGFYTCVVMDEVGCDTTFIVEVPEEITLRLQAVAGEDEVCPGNTAFVPLYVSNFNDVAYFKTTLLYDQALLTCSGYSNTQAQIEDSLEVMLFPAEGKVELLWHAPSVSLPDNTVLTDLVFESLDPGLSTVAWDGSAGASLFLNSTGLTIPVDYYLGSVRIYQEVLFSLVQDIEACQEDDVEIIPIVWSSNGEVSYLWSDPFGSTSTNEILSISNAQPFHSGIWSLRITDTLDCYSEDSVEITIHPTPVPAFAGQDTITTEEPVEIDAGSGFASYLWNTGATSQLITADVEDWYSVFIESQYGCFGQDSVYVLFWEPPEPPEPIADQFHFPNAFTPDGDGLNDVFKAIGQPDKLTSFSMKVFNRWGQMVFESSEISLGWDGTYQGKPAPAGTYVYRISYSIGDFDFDTSGTFIVLR